MTSATYQVIGMTCEHCVQAVAGELNDPAASVASRSISSPGASPR